MFCLFRRRIHNYLRPLEWRRLVLRAFECFLRRPPDNVELFTLISLTSTGDTFEGDTFMRELFDDGVARDVLFFLGTLLLEGEDSIEPILSI